MEPDIALWRGSHSKYKSRFNTSATWRHIRVPGQEKSWHKGIWFPDSIPKQSFLLWLAVHHRLTTCDRMLLWNRGVHPSCVLCQHPLETHEHLFFTCNFASRVWEGLTRKQLQHRYTCSFTAILPLLTDSNIKGTHRYILRLVFQSTVYSIWFERNRRRHGEIPSSPEQLIKFLDRLVRNKISSIQSLGSRKFEDGLQTWFALRS